jgi:lysophospholipase L1-like esterase
MRAIFLLLFSLFSLAAQEFKPGSAQPFQAGDTVCYVGDSITHGGTYHSIVTLFYTTRFPDREIQYYNDGISGDRASGIMSDERYRLNVDILSHKPTVATIMLGMNDVGRNDYGAGKTGPEIEKKRQASLDTYNENMVKLVAALRGVGSRIIFLTPSIYEEGKTLSIKDAAEDMVGVNGALGKCAETERKWAKAPNSGYADFYQVMNAVDERERKTDPGFTIVGKDRVHPGPVGHFVMAYTLLKAQGLPREVSKIELNAKKKQAGKLVNASVEKIAASADKLEFDALEKALPMVVPEEARPALKMVPFVQDLNQETLVVKGLKKGSYQLTIDGETVGEFDAAQLKRGVNLAENVNTPQYKQSEQATKIMAERTLVGKKIRDIVTLKYGLSKAKVDVLDRDTLLATLRTRLAAAEAKKDPAVVRLRAAVDDAAAPGKLEQQYDESMVALRKACQPRVHHYALVKK